MYYQHNVAIESTSIKKRIEMKSVGIRHIPIDSSTPTNNMLEKWGKMIRKSCFGPNQGKCRNSSRNSESKNTANSEMPKKEISREIRSSHEKIRRASPPKLICSKKSKSSDHATLKKKVKKHATHQKFGTSSGFALKV